MKIKYIIYNLKCHFNHEVALDYIEWLGNELFIKNWKGMKA